MRKWLRLSPQRIGTRGKSNRLSLVAVSISPPPPPPKTLRYCLSLYSIIAVPWLAYAALLNYRPRLPTTDRNSTSVDIRETAYWQLKEAALSLGTNLLALPFWEQFFMLHFEAVSRDPGFGDWLRDTLNPHWTRVAQHFEHAGAERIFYSLYYSFTTWSVDIIA